MTPCNPSEASAKTGQPCAFYYALPADSSGVLPDGQTFTGIRDLKHLLLTDERQIALNMAKQLTSYADAASASNYGLRSIVHRIVESDLFRSKYPRQIKGAEGLQAMNCTALLLEVE